MVEETETAAAVVLAGLAEAVPAAAVRREAGDLLTLVGLFEVSGIEDFMEDTK